MDDSEDATDVDPVGAEDVQGETPEEVMGHQPGYDTWEAVIEDMEATAAEYESRGWDTLEIHPGDVALLSPKQEDDGEDVDGVPGMDVIVPDDEFRDLADRFEDGFAVDGVEVYRADQEDMAYAVVVLEDAARETTVLVPLYYRHTDPEFGATMDRAHAEGVFHTRLRRLNGDAVIVSHEDPDLFAPDLEGK